MSTSSSPPHLSCLLDPDFGIPTDITFHILDDHAEGEGVVDEVVGHKLVLGLHSPVFRKMFYGPLRESRVIIPVRDTTLQGFKAMISHMYGRGVEWGSMEVVELYDLVNLAERYQITGLMDEVKTWMEKIPLSMDNVMDIAKTATHFTHFPAASSQLLLRCAKFIKQTLRTQARFKEFARFGHGDRK